MPRVKMLAGRQIDGRVHLPGDIVLVDESVALRLLRAGDARPATDDEYNTYPRPSDEARRLQEAQAIPGGPRPGRGR